VTPPGESLLGTTTSAKLSWALFASPSGSPSPHIDDLQTRPRKDGERLFDKVAFQLGTFRGMLPQYSTDETVAKVNLESLQLSRAV
jgi:hypothetical protein